MRKLTIAVETYPIAGTFTIARGSKTEAVVVVCTIHENDNDGRGESVPYVRYGETMETVTAQIESVRSAVQGGVDRQGLLDAMPAGAARNAIDCALWDLEAKRSGVSVATMIGLPAAKPIATAFTLSLSDPDTMFAQAGENSWRPLLKVKVGTSDDEERVRAVAAGAPLSRIILDANEGWTPDTIERYFQLAAELKIALIEQPLKAGADALLREIARPVPVCADESVHTAAELDSLVGLYDAVNIKLDKTGGLTAALELRDRARQHGFKIMIGCMVGSSLAMAPAVLLAQDADFVDLDGPLLLARDRKPALTYEGSLVSPPDANLWG